MNILIDIGHPAHVHLFRNLYKELTSRGHNVTVTVKDLQSAKQLLDLYKIPYLVVGRRGGSIASKALNQLYFNYKLLSLAFNKKIDLAIGSSITIAHISRLSRVRSIVFDDDDDDVQPLMTKYGHPFAHSLLSPSSLRGTRKKRGTIYYDGYHELAYLHPARFTPDPDVLKETGLEEGERFFIMRFNAFRAHHDIGVRGLSKENKINLATFLSSYGKVFITTEGEVEQELLKYKLSVAPHKIHSLLAYATMLVGDSQTMTSEAAVLGTPALRCNSFAGRISYLEEQEKIYDLTYAFLPDNFDGLFAKINELLSIHDLKKMWEGKRSKMLEDKIDVTSFMLWFVENYPGSEKDFLNGRITSERFKHTS